MPGLRAHIEAVPGHPRVWTGAVIPQPAAPPAPHPRPGGRAHRSPCGEGLRRASRPRPGPSPPGREPGERVPAELDPCARGEDAQPGVGAGERFVRLHGGRLPNTGTNARGGRGPTECTAGREWRSAPGATSIQRRMGGGIGLADMGGERRIPQSGQDRRQTAAREDIPIPSPGSGSLALRPPGKIPPAAGSASPAPMVPVGRRPATACARGAGTCPRQSQPGWCRGAREALAVDADRARPATGCRDNPPADACADRHSLPGAAAIQSWMTRTERTRPAGARGAPGPFCPSIPSTEGSTA